MTKLEAIAAFGTASALAEALGISRSAVSQWPDNEAIPKVHELRIKYELRPDVFGPAPDRKEAA